MSLLKLLSPLLGLSCLLLPYVAVAQSIIDLSGDGWTVQNLGLNISVPGSLPSQVHLDLFAAQVIGDPYYALNDFNLRWIAWNNWTYVSEPISGLKTSNGTSTYLLFEGLDTFTSISFCGQHIAATNNQFRQYYFDVSSLISNCSSPVISINFGSAPAITQQIADQPNQETWPAGVQQIYEFPNRWFMRKEQSDFGWDWGPAFAPAGPWLPAYVVQIASSELYVRNKNLDLFRQGQLNNLPPDQSQPWVFNASLDLIGSIPSGAGLMYSVYDIDTNKTVSSGSFGNITTLDNAISGAVVLDNQDYELWWPHGMGAQKLYNFTVNVVDSSNSTITSTTTRMGFRTIVLNMNPISDLQISQGIANGTNWHFEVNGHEFYAKGSNFIPPDAFWPRVDHTRIQTLFQMAVDGNQNMLRVWASGAYGPDFMYDIADELGLLLWSEFEFGDALYPVNEEFLANVAEEAAYQVRRLNHHPSLALWAGGNELESLELMLVNQTAPDQLARYTGEYEKLFLDTILPCVYSNSKSISYMPSSTNNGWLSLNFSRPIPIVERYQNLTPGYIYGDTDFYNYDSSNIFNFSEYPVGRFANEFGYHSYPSLQTWQQVLPSNQLYFNSSVVLGRNHHNPPGGLDILNQTNSRIGAGQITQAVERYYPTPNMTNSVANFSAWCQSTQIFQADLYRSEIQFYRRGSGFPERQLGSLYWQLEDIWQAPTWASIEYDGRWKYLHYAAKDIYEPIIISPFYNYTTGDFEVYVTSDLWTPANGTASLTWYSWDGKPIMYSNSNASTASTSSIPFTVGAINTTRVYATNLLSSNLNLTNAALFLNLTATGNPINRDEVKTYRHDNFFHPVPLREVPLVDPGLKLSYDETTKNFTVEATTGVATWTWLDYPAGSIVTFDSNAFALVPGQPKQVGYTVRSDSSNGKWIEGVTVRSLWNNTLS